MRIIRLAAALGLIAAVSGFPALAADQSVTFDKTFLTDYSRLVPRQTPTAWISRTSRRSP